MVKNKAGWEHHFENGGTLIFEIDFCLFSVSMIPLGISIREERSEGDKQNFL